jgi:hypothetical protein
LAAAGGGLKLSVDMLKAGRAGLRSTKTRLQREAAAAQQQQAPDPSPFVMHTNAVRLYRVCLAGAAGKAQSSLPAFERMYVEHQPL